MSYILEALKKAQAERALGSAPTVHAMPIHPVAAPQRSTGSASLWVGLVVGLLVAGAAWLVLRSGDGGHKAQAQATPVSAAPAAANMAPAAATMAQATTTVAPAAITMAPAAATMGPTAADMAAAPTVKLAPMPAEPSQPASNAAAASTGPEPALPPGRAAASTATRDSSLIAPPTRAPGGSTRPKPADAASQAAPSSTAVAAAPAPEEKLPNLSELPEAIARELPRVAIGGYIYSHNPADRLLLVDKVLRHEGEELAPGLVLEKLLPKAAVMNYKGYRYKIAY